MKAIKFVTILSLIVTNTSVRGSSVNSIFSQGNLTFTEEPIKSTLVEKINSSLVQKRDTHHAQLALNGNSGFSKSPIDQHFDKVDKLLDNLDSARCFCTGGVSDETIQKAIKDYVVEYQQELIMWLRQAMVALLFVVVFLTALRVMHNMTTGREKMESDANAKKYVFKLEKPDDFKEK